MVSLQHISRRTCIFEHRICKLSCFEGARWLSWDLQTKVGAIAFPFAFCAAGARVRAQNLIAEHANGSPPRRFSGDTCIGLLLVIITGALGAELISISDSRSTDLSNPHAGQNIVLFCKSLRRRNACNGVPGVW